MGVQEDPGSNPTNVNTGLIFTETFKKVAYSYVLNKQPGWMNI